MSSDCVICTEKLTKRSKLVVCGKCDNNSCRKCFQTYLLNSPLSASCMHCKTELSNDFVIENTETNWRLSVYKTYKETVLMDIEKARLPETQQYAMAVKEACNLISALNKEYSIMASQIKQYPGMEPDPRLINNRRNYYDCYQIWQSYGRHSITSPEQVTFTRGCPMSNCKGFLGKDFVCGLCSTSVCADCREPNTESHQCNPDIVASINALEKESKACPSCASMISKIDGCDQMWCTQCQTTFSWRTGQKELGRVHNPHYYQWMRLNGGLAREPGDRPDVACGVPNLNVILKLFSIGAQNKYRKLSVAWNKYSWFVRSIGGGYDETFEETVKRMTEQCANAKKPRKYGPYTLPEGAIRRPEFQTEPRRDYMFLANLCVYHRAIGHRLGVVDGIQHPNDNHDLRVRFLLGEISEAHMRYEVQKRHKATEKRQAVTHINTMLNDVSNDLFRKYYDNLKNADGAWEKVKNNEDGQVYYLNRRGEKSDVLNGQLLKDVHLPIHQAFNKEMLALISYTNNCYEKIGKTYNNSIHKVLLNYDA